MTKKQKGKVLNIVVLICMVIIFLIFILTIMFMKDTFHYSTSINGIDCSFLNINDAIKKLEKTMNGTQITLLFAENKEYTCLGAYFDFDINSPNALLGILSTQKDSEENKNRLKKYIMEHGAWNKGKKLSKEHLEKITAERRTRCNKKIYALDKDTMQIVKEFSSCTEASIYVGISKSNISRCCKGKRPTSGGYKWRYANEN